MKDSGRGKRRVTYLSVPQSFYFCAMLEVVFMSQGALHENYYIYVLIYVSHLYFYGSSHDMDAVHMSCTRASH